MASLAPLVPTPMKHYQNSVEATVIALYCIGDILCGVKISRIGQE